MELGVLDLPEGPACVPEELARLLRRRRCPVMGSISIWSSASTAVEGRAAAPRPLEPAGRELCSEGPAAANAAAAEEEDEEGDKESTGVIRTGEVEDTVVEGGAMKRDRSGEAGDSWMASSSSETVGEKRERSVEAEGEEGGGGSRREVEAEAEAGMMGNEWAGMH